MLKAIGSKERELACEISPFLICKNLLRKNKVKAIMQQTAITLAL